MTRQFYTDHRLYDVGIVTSGGIMKKLLSIMISLTAVVFLQCEGNQPATDAMSLLAITSGFSSSYMEFQITDGLTIVPEYNVLTAAAGLSANGTDYDGTFTGTTSGGVKGTVSIVLPSPAKGTQYLESSSGLFTYVRQEPASSAVTFTIDTAYSGGNDFIVTVTEWGGKGTFMEATFSGYVCNGGSCLTIENGYIKALTH